MPHLNKELFEDKDTQVLFEEISTYINKYNTLPNKDVIRLILNNKNTLTETDVQECLDTLDSLDSIDNKFDIKWLIDETEKFCQERSLQNAIRESIYILDGSDKIKDKGMIPKLLSDALAVSFDPNIGHDFIEDAESRYEYYHHIEERIPFDIEMLNKITKGGLPRKTLNVILAGVNVGKTLFLCHTAAAALQQNKNVLYITLEMAQERIAQRIDANMLNVSMDTIESLTKETYQRKIEKLRQTITGKLVIKEFPTASASVIHFKSLLNELKIKKSFIPDLIIIDYINICSSGRIKQGNNVNSYTFIKAIAEELRGLAVECNLPILTATQLNREGFGSSDPDMTDTAESFGLPATADFMGVMIASADLPNQIIFKQIKSRYGDVTKDTKFALGIDRAKQRLYELDQKAQDPTNIGFDSNQTNPNKEFIRTLKPSIKPTINTKTVVQESTPETKPEKENSGDEIGDNLKSWMKEMRSSRINFDIKV